jgi:hypothetical protein
VVLGRRRQGKAGADRLTLGLAAAALAIGFVVVVIWNSLVLG